MRGYRIFNPGLQSKSRDNARIGIDYPMPVVDHREARREYLDLGKRKVAR